MNGDIKKYRHGTNAKNGTREKKNNLLLHVTKTASRLSREQWHKIDQIYFAPLSPEQSLKIIWIFPTFLLHEKRKQNYGTRIFFHLHVQWSNVPLHEHEKSSSGALALASNCTVLASCKSENTNMNCKLCNPR